MMSGLLNSTLNGSTSNLPDSMGRSFTTSFSAQSATSPGFPLSGGMQGLHNMHGSFNLPNMAGSISLRNTGISGIASSGVQQPVGSLSSGRFASNNFPVANSQMSHGSSHGLSGITNRGGIGVVGSPSMDGVGGSISGISSSSATAINRNSVPGLGVSPLMGNVGPRITNSVGNIVGGGNVGRSISSGGLSMPGLASRVNLTTNSGSGSLNVQGPNRLMTGMLQQAPQMIGMLGNSYPTSGGPLSQSQVQAGNNPLSSMRMLNDLKPNDHSPFDINDFPQLTARPSSSGGPQGQLGSLRKQGVGASSVVQQNQEFSIQNEDFPALPGFKGGNSDFSMDLHQKEQLHENVSIMQSQHFSMARSAGFSLAGSYPPNRQQQQQLVTSVSSAGVSFAPGNNQDLLHLHGSDVFPSSHGTFHSQVQNSGPSLGLRTLNSPNPSGIGAYEQLMQQYPHPQNQSQFRLQQMSAVSQSLREQSVKSMQGTQTTPDRFGLLGLLSVIRMSDAELTSLALGIDLTTLGLNLNSEDNLHKTFRSPWFDELPKRREPEYIIPLCYNAEQPPPLQQGNFSRFQLETLFYIFYSMPRDEAQVYAAYELYTRGWFYHKEHQFWLTRVANVEPLVKTHTYERGSYVCFNWKNWEFIRKDNFVLYYESIEKLPTLPLTRSHQ